MCHWRFTFDIRKSFFTDNSDNKILFPLVTFVISVLGSGFGAEKLWHVLKITVSSLFISLGGKNMRQGKKGREREMEGGVGKEEVEGRGNGKLVLAVQV